jgi:hypothetical protein
MWFRLESLVCIHNGGECDADLVVGKIYRLVKPKRNGAG